MNEQKFMICGKCGNLVGIIHDSGAPVVCCGDPMEVLTANTVDASHEKHVPDVRKDGSIVTVQVGSVLHPSTAEHNIGFIYLKTENGGQKKHIKPGSDPVAVFSLADDKPLSVYAYCNLHGLWKTDI